VVPECRPREDHVLRHADGLYRLNGCDVCQRYIKAFDGRNATRQVMPVVDTLATLPLDAAAVQRGYR
jgi:formate dehydrogenase maturation protein FdhE